MDARIYGPAREAALEDIAVVETDTRCAEVQAKCIGAILPLAEVEAQAARNCGLAGRGNAHLLDAARLIHEEWDAVSASSIVQCWVKSTIIPPVMSALLVSAHGEYTGGFEVVGRDMDEVLALLKNTSLGREAFSGEQAQDVREGVRLWFGADDGENAILETVDAFATAADGTYTEE